MIAWHGYILDVVWIVLMNKYECVAELCAFMQHHVDHLLIPTWHASMVLG